MFRIAKPESFLFISPTRSQVSKGVVFLQFNELAFSNIVEQVGRQNTIECKPLILEPQSSFYTSPVVVLDFQSLYPSIMIAYNYCYSTCLGRVVGYRGANKLGVINYHRPKGLLALCADHINGIKILGTLASSGVYAKEKLN